MKHLLILLLGFLFLQPAYAHIRMMTPKPRLDVDNLKQNAGNPGPCGGQVRGTTPYIYEPNQIVPITFQETINHPGRFIVQFSLANDVGFELPQNELARLEDTMAGGMRTLQPRMPNVECTTCTLRVIQVMDDQPGELYVHCIDINLRAAAVVPPPPPPPPPPGPGALDGETTATATKPGFGCGLVSDISSGSGPGANGGAMRWALVLLMLPFLMLNFLRQRVRITVRKRDK